MGCPLFSKEHTSDNHRKFTRNNNILWMCEFEQNGGYNLRRQHEEGIRLQTRGYVG
jgi:hypothetical protein